MADRVAVMYGGKIVEVGTAEEIFYNPQHPYTWGLLGSMPTLEGTGDRLYAIPGSPPDLLDPPTGDAFILEMSLLCRSMPNSNHHSLMFHRPIKQLRGF